MSGTNLFAATSGGVWRRPLSEMIASVSLSSSEVPSNFRLEQNFPNLFNPSTIIRLSVPYRTHASLKVFDLLGEEVAVLTNEELPAGTYETFFHAKYLPTGVLYYRLQAGDFTQTKKLLLVR